MTGQPTLIAIAVVERNDQFLVGKRADHLPLGGYWEFPGGKVQEQESIEAAAVRECREETGLAVEVIARLPSQSIKYPHGILQLHFRVCRLADPMAQPHPPWLWLPRRDLGLYRFPEGNRGVIELLLSDTGTRPLRKGE